MGQPLIIMDDIDLCNTTDMVPFNEGKFNESVMAPGTTFYATILEQKLIDNQQLIINNEFDYKLNSFGLRCDEFDASFATQNFLFAGCSFTFGEGLPQSKTWSAILNDKLGMKNYYSLGYCGGSIEYIIDNIYNYINTFGKPKHLFILFPDVFRRSGKHNGRDVIFLPADSDGSIKDMVWDGDSKNAFRYNIELIIKLETYCKNMDIPLAWSTWNNEFAFNIDKSLFNNYVKFNNNKAKGLNVKQPYFNKARDGAHPGVEFNYMIANMFHNVYNSKENKKSINIFKKKYFNQDRFIY